MEREKIVIFDTTLRDGEQSPGASLTTQEKVEIAHQLARLNVDVIEAGFPISSRDDFEAVGRISQEVQGPIICGLARAVEKDIDRCWEAVKYAAKPRIHTFIGTSDIHLKGQLRKTRDEVLKMAVSAVQQAKSMCKDVEFSPMDASRTDPQYLYDVIEATIEAGATVINIPDTVGYAVPDRFGKLIGDIKGNVPNIGQVVLSVHCHDDLGMAVANTLFAIKNGARQVECTINGVGERAGNTALEEVVMAVRTRQDYFHLTTGVKTREIFTTSRLVSRLMGISVSPNKAVVGSNAFAHSSGIHQDGVLKERSTFEIMRPEDVGIKESQIVLTARSGRHALRHRLGELGYHLSGEQLNKTYERFLAVADKKKEIFDEDLIAIVEDEIHEVPEKYHLEYLHTSSGTGTVPTATVRIRIDDEVVQEAAWGDGPVDATYKAINKVTKIEAQLDEYSIKAVTSGTEALGEVTVKLKDNDRTVVGRGASTDIIEASAKAYIDGINKLVVRRRLRGDQ
ncbi:MAG TPA: 2-isopropylmalate synthase [Candidatus Latescibacteria bacterium]|nr:2-isopropylmalate synthase [Candidatus Latescibacterota bacterium]